MEDNHSPFRTHTTEQIIKSLFRGTQHIDTDYKLNITSLGKVRQRSSEVTCSGPFDKRYGRAK